MTTVFCARPSTAPALLVLVSLIFSHALLGSEKSREQDGEKSSPVQLLENFYDTAGVCTTSSIDAIIDSGNGLTVYIDIEPSTAKALLTATESRKDDWFSLHCPPSIHGVWKQQKTISDVLINGSISDSQRHSLSCRNYLSLDQNRNLTFGEQLRRALERALGSHQ